MNENFEFDYKIFENNYTLPLTEDSCRTKERILLIATLSFAKHGYAAVSMRDLAKIMGINQSSIYNHFESKDALWKEVIHHAGRLYKLYFEHLGEKVAACTTLQEVLEAIFYEPKRMLNTFTCYAFSMIQTEQFRDAKAGEMFEEIFMKYAIDHLRNWFDKCIATGIAPRFDTQTVAVIIMHSVLMGLQVEVHNLLNHQYNSPYDPRKMLQDVQNFIYGSVTGDGIDTEGQQH
jgi:Transcriptional regulator